MILSEYVEKWGTRILYILFYCLVLFRLCCSGGEFLDRTASYLSYPFLKIHSGIRSSIDGFKTKFQTLDDLKKELHYSFEEIEKLESRIIELEQQTLFYEKTKELVAFSHRYNESFYLLSKILLRKFDNNEHLLYLDVGSRQGVQKNMIVVYNNCLVGRVIRVYGWYSEAVCISDRRCKIAADVYGTEIEGIYEGANDQLGFLKFIPHFKTVSVGDRIYSAGKGLMYPQGFLLGTITAIKSGAVDQEMLIQPAIDFNSLDYVYLIKS